MTSLAVGRSARVAAEAAGAWHRWHASAPLTVGVEEEVMLLDPATWTLAQRVEDALSALPPSLAARASAETHQAALELATKPHRRVSAAVEDLRRLRAGLSAALALAGLRVACAGTHPSARWQETRVSPDSRHQLVHATMRGLARREPTFALHVHVGVPDAEAAIDLANRMRVHLPLLLALSANSPYWQGRDAGFASSRTVVFGAFPRTGMPRRYTSYADWRDALDALMRSGAIPEPTFMWWDVRVQPRLGTVEVRVMDVQTTVEATASLVALVQSVASLELREGYAGLRAVSAQEALEENRFLAARDGLGADLIDPERLVRRPARKLVAELVAAARPHAADLGCSAELDGLAALLASPGCDDQRRRAGRDGLPGLVATLARRFVPGAPRW